MKSIIYSVYRGGSAGLSNLIMSVELGVILARLTDRVLVLEGNRTPIANVVKYAGPVRNAYPSRVTDLIDLGVPWIEASETDIAAFAPLDICPWPLWECTFYYPAHLSCESEDIRAFAGRRDRFVTIDDRLDGVPALSLSGGPERHTLAFYSYFFYLDHGAQLQAFDALRRIRPKKALAAFAKRIADDLGPFNAVHIRRGDFKLTRGVTTLDRAPAEAIAALDAHFARTDRLVVLTDEAGDPFFDDIKAAYPDHVFLDRHILDNYLEDFLDLPAHDSIALAYLSQLVAAESADFIGSMTSTFTSLIQRMRGNLGRDEPFKFLWNELPAPGEKLERGRHAFSDCIRLDKGVMIADRDGPYSWNRYDQRLNAAWMREWPEGFLDETAMVERARGRAIVLRQETAEPASRASQSRPAGRAISFLGSGVLAGSNDAATDAAIAELFASMLLPSDTPPVGDVRIEAGPDRAALFVNGRRVGKDRKASGLMRALYREVVCRFIDGFPELIWLHAACAASPAGAAVLPGVWGRGKSSLVVALCERGWSFLSDDVVPLDSAAGTAMPFPATPRMRPKSLKEIPRDRLSDLPKSVVPLDRATVETSSRPVAMFVFPHFSPGAPCRLTPMPPGQALGELLENCLSLAKNEDATIERLCAMVERLPVYRLRFGDAAEAADVLADLFASQMQAVRTGDAGDNNREGTMDESQAVTTVEVEVTLNGGTRYSSVLPFSSPILHDLYVALAARHAPDPAQRSILIQLPIDGGRAACSFMSDSLVSLITRPPVLIQAQAAGTGHGALPAGPLPFVRIDDFLTPGENGQLLDYAIASEAEYVASKVTSDRKGHRKSKVLFTIKDSRWRGVFMSRLKLHLPHIAASLNVPSFQVGDSEIQLTASNDGEYFKAHADAGHKGERTSGREITFVYYLNRVPRRYDGGDLLFYDGWPGQPGYDRGSGVTAVTPQNNCLIAFASRRWHEVDMVRCPSGEFADSRFTVNGWLRRAAA